MVLTICAFERFVVVGERKLERERERVCMVPYIALFTKNNFMQKCTLPAFLTLPEMKQMMREDWWEFGHGASLVGKGDVSVLPFQENGSSQTCFL